MDSVDRLQAILRGDDPATITRIDRYEVEREIGRGGMAVVYEAWDPQLERRVAIKVLHHPSADRLLKEASAAARLTHPNVAAIHEVGPSYIVMQLIEGQTLAEAAGKMDLGARVRAVEAVARAVAHAHRQGVV